MTNPTAPESKGDVVARGPLWHWFAAGFLLVFIGVAALWPMTVRIGPRVTRVALWRFYKEEVFGSVSFRTLGAGMEGPDLLSVGFCHLALALVGGSLTLGIGWLLARSPR